MAAKARTIVAPVGGWNARDALADMPEQDAVLLDNWFPMEGCLKQRMGYAEHQTGLGGWVETLPVYDNGASQKLLACANGHIRDVTSGTTSLASGFSVNAWQYATLDGTMGLVNGTDTPQTYNGSTVGAMTLTGPTAANVVGVNVFKSRSYFWEEGSQSFWYSAINTMGGAVSEFKLGRVGNITGHMVAMNSLTRDGGDGPDDLAVFVYSSGDVVIYQGSDPGDAALWSLVGLYRIGAPIGRRCTMKFNGDLVVITLDGYVSLTDVLRKRNASFSDKVRPAVTFAAATGKAFAWWQPAFFPAANLLLFNVPTSNSESVQHAMNTTTGAWTRFTGWNARCWAVFNDLLYFGGNGAVYKAWSGTSDNGAGILCDAVPAFSSFGSNRRKQVTALQPTLETNGTIDVAVKTEKDYALTARPSANLSTGATSSPWGSAWGSPWSKGVEGYSPLKKVTRVGRALSGRITIETVSHAVKWYATTYFYEDGGFV